VHRTHPCSAVSPRESHDSVANEQLCRVPAIPRADESGVCREREQRADPTSSGDSAPAGASHTLTGTARKTLLPLEGTMSHNNPRSLLPLVALLFVAGCSSLTEPEKKLAPAVAAHDGLSQEQCEQEGANPNCYYNPPPQPMYDPQIIIVGDSADITAQDDFVRVWMNSAEFRDTLPGVIIDAYQPGEFYCQVNGYANPYNGQISGNCPTGPCYEQWRNFRNAGWTWSGFTSGIALTLGAARNSWGLFKIGLPAAPAAAVAWSNVEYNRQKYIMCMSQDNNWNFYYPQTWNDPNPYAQPRYPNGMPR
jgi:hypothetical protein